MNSENASTPAGSGTAPSALQGDITTPLMGPHSGLTTPEETLKKGASLGRYVVLELLGAGGMGSVYSAFDPELDRRVAVKLVRVKTETGSPAQTRLLREAQAMAKLSHPNVVSVFDVGVVDGRVFVAMELVRGSTVSEWARAAPRHWRDVVDVYRAAGRGLAAAHGAGMVHRDVKPDNVLIDTEGRVRLSDFGLARASIEAEGAPLLLQNDEASSGSLLSASMTNAAAVPGTPAFMAPEQLEGAGATALSDQFSFCVALYRTLYGQLPFNGPLLPLLLASIRQGEARPPPATSKVPQWVHRALLKGLSALPSNRFASIDALLTALGDDPAVKRKRWLVASAALGGVLALATGAAAATRAAKHQCDGAETKLVGVWDDARKTAIRAALVETKVSYALDAWLPVERTFDAYASDWAAQHKSACEATRLHGEQSDEVLTLRMQCLREVLGELSTLSSALTGATATSVAKLSRLPAALTDLNACADIAALERRAPLPKSPELQQRIDAVSEKLNRALAVEAIGNMREALPLYEAASAEAKEIGYPPLKARALVRQMTINGKLSRYDEAYALVFETLEAAEAARDDTARCQALASLAKLAEERSANLDEAVTYARLALSVVDRLASPEFHRAHIGLILGNIYYSRKKYPEAREAYERALASAAGHARSSLTADQIRYNLNLILLEQGSVLKAKAGFLEDLKATEARLGAKHPEVAYDWQSLGEISLLMGDPDSARAQYDKSLEIRLAALGPMSLLTLESRIGRAEVMIERGQLGESQTELEDICSKFAIVAPNSGEAARCLVGLANTFNAQKKHLVALDWANRAIELQRADGSRPAVSALLEKGRALDGLGRFDAARSALNEALDVATSEGRASAIAWVHISLATVATHVNETRSRSQHIDAALEALKSLDYPAVKHREAIAALQTTARAPGAP